MTPQIIARRNGSIYHADMAILLLSNLEQDEAFQELLWQCEPFPDGREPERRVVYSGVSWERYLKLDVLRGQDNPNPRLYFFDGELEIMTRSFEHERIKKWIGGFIDDYLFEINEQDVWTRGEATMLSALEEASAEPDDSWCIGEEKEFPNLVLEVALTSGGIRKLEIYRRFAASEVWFWRRGRLEIFVLRADGKDYDKAETGSRLLPKLAVALLERCVGITNWLEARRTFRAGLAAGK